MSNSWATAPQLCLFLKDSCLYAMCRPTVRQLSRYDLFNLFWLHVQVPEIVLVCSWMRLYGTSMYSVVLKSWIVFFPQKIGQLFSCNSEQVLSTVKKRNKKLYLTKRNAIIKERTKLTPSYKKDVEYYLLGGRSCCWYARCRITN